MYGDNIMNMQKIMQEAQKAQVKMQEAQKRIADMSVEGSAGGDMIKITATGKGEITKVKIEPSLVSLDGLELLEDLIVAAANDVQDKIKNLQDKEIGAVMGSIPGFGT